MDEKQIYIEDLKINYFEKGNGFPLLLVHGMGSSIVWDSVADELSNKYRVIVIDLPGFGKSHKPKITYTSKYYTQVLYEFLKKLEISEIYLAGLSLGGMIVCEFTGLYPDMVMKLVVISSAGLKAVASHIRYPLVYQLIGFFMKSIIFSRRSALRKYLESSFYNKSIIPDWVFNKYYDMMQLPDTKTAYLNVLRIVLEKDPDFPKRVKEIDCPSLIIWGENDPTFSIEYARQFNKLIKNSELVIIPECGHTVTLEKPDEFLKNINKFLK